MTSQKPPGPSRIWIFVAYHLPFLLFAAAILTVSRIPYLKSPNLRFLAFDKLAHFSEYAVFAFLTFRSFSHIGKRLRPTMTVLVAILFIAGFAAFDEYSQRFVPGRVSDPTDFTTDLAGAVLVVLFFGLRAWRKSTEQ
jgi:VanZ family protein